ncbi:GNAT family N-acetyltransferase [Brachybacterium tyrofermentans]|uniref:GNAT family N-acetyltransferase n=1 Tax=Brachybacterium tyrofermentans TaxID=47848 RepID=A0ABW0FFV7_9MICO|nr:GNAT family N-acetyltransferase [Brachybacterium tyrofermentans]SLN05495.1 Acetyltransferase [Corynebacterium xerosis]
MSPALRLVPPSVSRHAAFVDCLADFAGTAMDGSSIFDPGIPPVGDGEFIDFVTARLAEEDPSTELEEPWVHCTSRWIIAADGSSDGSCGVDDPGAEILGFIVIRHRLTTYLFDQGGHIGYSVRPSARRQGIASAALELGLAEARGLGISPVLVTCDEDNVASRRTIEKAGGQYENSVEGKRRYWIDDGTRPARPSS